MQDADRLCKETSSLHFLVANCEHFYGLEFVVYNVWGLLHIADDVQYFGSSFKYENCLQTIKRLVRGASNTMAQVTKRLHEYESVHGAPLTVNSPMSSMKLSRSGRDSVVCLNSGRFAHVTKIDNHKLLCSLYWRRMLHPFYTKPCH